MLKILKHLEEIPVAICVAKMMSMNFADNLAKGFDDVPPRFRKLLD